MELFEDSIAKNLTDEGTCDKNKSEIYG